MYSIQIQHNIESAHRFFQTHASQKCRSIHGHRWIITLTLGTLALNEQGMVLEFSELKTIWRTWLDTHLDHALLLNSADPMVAAVQTVEPSARLFLMATDPTTEHLAHLLHDQAQIVIAKLDPKGSVKVQCVRVEETQVNAAEYRPGDCG